MFEKNEWCVKGNKIEINGITYCPSQDVKCIAHAMMCLVTVMVDINDILECINSNIRLRDVP